jgi:hypothetical protein
VLGLASICKAVRDLVSKKLLVESDKSAWGWRQSVKRYETWFRKSYSWRATRVLGVGVNLQSGTRLGSKKLLVGSGKSAWGWRQSVKRYETWFEKATRGERQECLGLASICKAVRDLVSKKLLVMGGKGALCWRQSGYFSAKTLLMGVAWVYGRNMQKRGNKCWNGVFRGFYRKMPGKHCKGRLLVRV